MKHATATALDVLEPLLAELRGVANMKERTRGVFYRRGKAFLHFHEDPDGLFADLREGEDFVRFKVGSISERQKFLKAVKACT
tara:strand:+ start:144 stop:392 length:249 start_codon:yes stop_codon:yes gene_type:complete